MRVLSASSRRSGPGSVRSCSHAPCSLTDCAPGQVPGQVCSRTRQSVSETIGRWICGTLGQVPPGAVGQGDHLLAQQVVPLAALGVGPQPGEVVAYRRVNAERAVSLAKDQAPANQGIEQLPQGNRVERGQRPGQGPFLLVKPAQRSHPPQGEMFARQIAQLLLCFPPVVQQSCWSWVVAVQARPGRAHFFFPVTQFLKRHLERG